MHSIILADAKTIVVGHHGPKDTFGPTCPSHPEDEKAARAVQPLKHSSGRISSGPDATRNGQTAAWIHADSGPTAPVERRISIQSSSKTLDPTTG